MTSAKVEMQKKGRWTHFVDLLGLKGCLHDFEVRNEFILVLGVHLDPGHRDVSWQRIDASEGRLCHGDQRDDALLAMRTVDGVENLAIGTACTTLLDLRVVELQKLVKPSKQVCARNGCHDFVSSSTRVMKNRQKGVCLSHIRHSKSLTASSVIEFPSVDSFSQLDLPGRAPFTH